MDIALCKTKSRNFFLCQTSFLYYPSQNIYFVFHIEVLKQKLLHFSCIIPWNYITLRSLWDFFSPVVLVILFKEIVL